jgi:hypothetical protein
MNLKNVTPKLAEILVEYQDPVQDPADRIDPDIKPLEDIKGFDSHFIPEIVRLLARELGDPLPKGTKIRNIFVERGKKLTVREIARKFVEKYSRKGSKV